MRLAVDRPPCSVDRPSRPTPTESSHHIVGRPLFSHGRPRGRPFYACARRAHRSTGRSTGLLHRSTVRSTGCFPGLLQCAVRSLCLPISVLSFSISSLSLQSPPGEDFQNLSQTPTNSNISSGEIDTRSRRNRHTISA